jgi:hypothetical protein
VTTRRSRDEGGLHWSEARQRWVATATIGFDGHGKRITRKASGATTKTEAKNKLRKILRGHTVEPAAALTDAGEVGARTPLGFTIADPRSCRAAPVRLRIGPTCPGPRTAPSTCSLACTQSRVSDS